MFWVISYWNRKNKNWIGNDININFQMLYWLTWTKNSTQLSDQKVVYSKSFLDREGDIVPSLLSISPPLCHYSLTLHELTEELFGGQYSHPPQSHQFFLLDDFAFSFAYFGDYNSPHNLSDSCSPAFIWIPCNNIISVFHWDAFNWKLVNQTFVVSVN